jgi:hypothetical protein
MVRKELIDLLSLHAENLKDGVDLSEKLMEQESGSERRNLASLLALARRVRDALAPVDPRLEFVSALKAQLRVEARRLRLEADRVREVRKRRLLWAAAGAGVLIYVTGLMLVGLRVSGLLLGLIAGWLGWRSTRPAAPKPRLGH